MFGIFPAALFKLNNAECHAHKWPPHSVSVFGPEHKSLKCHIKFPHMYGIKMKRNRGGGDGGDGDTAEVVVQ